MFRSTTIVAAAFLMTALPDAVQAQRWRYGRRGVYVGAPYVSVGVGNYYRGGSWYGYRGGPYYYNRGWYGYGASPYYYGWSGYPTTYYYPNYVSSYVLGPSYYSSNYVAQPQSGLTTSYYNGPPVSDMQVQLTVILPKADARLMVQDRLNEATGIERRIVSPTLNANTDYHYTLRATWLDDTGKEITREKVIAVKPGQQYTVDFNQS